MEELERWLSEEGVETASRQVLHMEYDSNWTDAFRVILREPRDGEWEEFVGGGPNRIGGLEVAVHNAIEKARARAVEVK